MQLAALHQQDIALKMQYLNIERQQKDINGAFYEVKGEMQRLNPKP